MQLFFYNDADTLLEDKEDANTLSPLRRWLKQGQKTFLRHAKKIEISAFQWLPIEVAIIHCLLLLTPSLETMDTLVDDSMDMVKKPLGEGPDVFRRLAAPPKVLVRFLNWDKR